MLHFIKFILILFLFLVGLGFYLRNNQPIVLDYYLGYIELPMLLMLFIVLLFGALLGFLGSLPVIARLKRHQFRLQKMIKSNEQESK